MPTTAMSRGVAAPGATSRVSPAIPSSATRPERKLAAALVTCRCRPAIDVASERSVATWPSMYIPVSRCSSSVTSTSRPSSRRRPLLAILRRPRLSFSNSDHISCELAPASASRCLAALKAAT